MNFLLSELELTNDRSEFDFSITLNDEDRFETFDEAWKRANDENHMMIIKPPHKEYPYKVELQRFVNASIGIKEKTLKNKTRVAIRPGTLKAEIRRIKLVNPNVQIKLNELTIGEKPYIIGPYGLHHHIYGHRNTIASIANEALCTLRYGLIIAMDKEENRVIIPFEEPVPLFYFEEYFLRAVHNVEISINAFQYARENIFIVLRSHVAGDFTNKTKTNKFYYNSNNYYICYKCATKLTKSGCTKACQIFIRGEKIYARFSGKHEYE